MKKLLDEQQTAEAFDRLFEAVASQLPAGERIAVIGIRSRGEILARRMVDRLRQEKGIDAQLGLLDITFYRDDLSRRRGAKVAQATEIGFDLNDTWLLLVDDVLQTGRSVRAALDALHDFGRPRMIRLAVLIDRGGHELPIAADFVGQRFEAPQGEVIKVRLKESDGEEGVFITKKRK
jgi:pyrimidine operon attenuation protein / uracil phosphoribosyltransferase